MKQARPYKISAISYLNTKPFLYGLERSGLLEKNELKLDAPSATAERLKNGQSDIGLVPVGVLPELKGYRIIGNHCIACKGAVKTVCIFSNDPIEEITSIWLDHQSRTSVELVRILARDLWKIRPEWIQGKKTDVFHIGGGKAALVIGDRAFDLIGKYSFVYDLGSAWHELHDLPFVFACWVTMSAPDSAFAIAFERALKYGVDNLEKVAMSCKRPGIDEISALKYLRSNICYNIGKEEKKSMNLFLKSLVPRSNSTESSLQQNQ